MTLQDTSKADRSAPADAVPPVVAVVVAADPGAWFDELLDAFALQEYPNLSVLILDADSEADLLHRVATRLPSAYVRRLSANTGFGPAANVALDVVQNARFLLLCHDDVAPAPDAVSRLVEEGLRSNAGVVVPKLVAWDDPRRLLSMGGGLDRTGAFLPMVEEGELDQGQHDASAEVLVGTGGCTLVRMDLFQALGGYDAEMAFYGEDLDLCWRAHIAGARVVTSPRAVVRHVAAGSRRMRDIGPLQEEIDDGTGANALHDHVHLRRRHRLRMVLKCRRGLGLLWSLVVLALTSAGEVAYKSATGRHTEANAVAAAWTWNILRWRSLVGARRAQRRVRAVKDRDVARRLGSSRGRIEGILRAEWEERRARLASERQGLELIGALRNLPMAVWATVLVLWVVGSRSLLGGLPELGQFAGFPASATHAVREFLGLQPDGTWGSAAPAPVGNLILGAVGFLVGGAMGALQLVVVLGMLPLGVFGVLRLARPLLRPQVRLLAVLAYAVAPLPYDALQVGRWDVLVAYGTAPWLLARLLSAHGAPPFTGRLGTLQVLRRRSAGAREELQKIDALDHGASGRAADMWRERSVGMDGGEADAFRSQRWVPRRRDRVAYLTIRRAIPTGLLLSTAGAFAPGLVGAVAVVAGLLAIGAVLTADREARTSHLIIVAAGAVLSAAGLLAPSLLGSVDGVGSLWHGASTAVPTSFGAALVGSLGVEHTSSWTYGLLLAALPGVLIGHGWRFQLSFRLWLVTVASATLAWASGRGWLRDAWLDTNVLMSTALAALALNVAIGALTVREDLRTYRFGWRHLLPVVVLCGVVTALVPVASRASDGSWGAPGTTNAELLSWMSDRRLDGAFRVVWLGADRALPGTPLVRSGDLSVVVAADGATAADGWTSERTGSGPSALLQSIDDARRGATVRLGHQLAGQSVRYLVVPSRAGIAKGDAPVPVPRDLDLALSSQLDLHAVERTDSVVVWENDAWLPGRAQLSQEAALAAHSSSRAAGIDVDLSQSRAVLPRRDGVTRWSGPVAAGEVLVSQDQHAGWHLQVDGKAAAWRGAFGWANAFVVERGGTGVLTYSPALPVLVVQVAVVVVWLALLVLVLRSRSYRSVYG